MKARWLTLFACVPLIVGTMLLQSCGGVGGPAKGSTSPGSNQPTQAFLALLTPEQKGAKNIGPEACGTATCHGGAAAKAHIAMKTASLKKMGSGDNQYTTWKDTAHAQKGVTCEKCHGPGSAHAAMPQKADGTANAILTFPNIASPTVCGQCHGPTHDEFMASKHAELIASPISSTVTGPTTSGQASQCFECHGGLTRAQYLNNGITPEQMTSAQIVQVANDTLNSLPHVALCATCHNPHAKTGNLTGNGKEVQLYNSEVLTDSSGIGPGTTPPQYTRVNQVCGQCHNGRGTTATDAYLNSSTSRPSAHHSNQFNSLLGVGGAENWNSPPSKRSGTHALAPGQCATCHMPNARHTFTVSYDGCAPCHTTSDAAARASALKAEVSNDLLALETRMSSWAVAQGWNAACWDYTSNIPSGVTAPKQTLIPNSVKEARHNYYYIVISGDLGIHNPSYTRYLLDWSNNALTSAGIPKVNMSEITKIPTAAKIKHFQQIKAKSANSSMD